MAFDEEGYRTWKEKYAPQDSGQDYDLRGAFEAGLVPTNGHFPDTFKRPDHPRFSIESKYWKPGMPAGRWEGENYIPMTGEEATSWVQQHGQNLAQVKKPMADVYDPSQQKPMEVQGGDWSSMAPALIPGILGLLMGGPGVGLGGLIGGAGGIQDERQKAIKYNNELQFKQQQAAAEQERLGMSRTRLGMEQEQAAREKESHDVALKQAQFTLDQNLKTEEGRKKIRSTLTDPNQQALFDMNPGKYSDFMLDNVKRQDLAHRWEKVLPNITKLPPGVSAGQVVEAFGEKIPEWIQHQEQQKIAMAHLGLEAQRLALEKQRADKPQMTMAENGELIVERYPSGDIKIKKVSDILGEDYTNQKELRDITKQQLNEYNKSDILKAQMTPAEYLNLPEQRAMQLLLTRKASPQEYGSMVSEMIRDKQVMEERAKKTAGETWAKTKWTKQGPEDIKKYLGTREGRQAVENAMAAEKLKKRSYTAPVNPTKDDLAPAATSGGRPTLDSIFK